MRGLLFVKNGLKNTYIDLFFDAYWQDALNLNDEKIIFNILKKIKISKGSFLKNIKDQKIKDKL